MKISYLKESFKMPYMYFVLLAIILLDITIKSQEIDLFSQIFAVIFLILFVLCLIRENNRKIVTLKYKTGKRLTL